MRRTGESALVRRGDLSSAATAETRADLLGAWRGLRNAAGDRPVDLARRGKHAHLVGMLEPPRRIEVPAERLRRIQVYFHAVIRARVQHLVDQHALRLPELEVLLKLDEPRMWFPMPDMHGRLEFWLEPDGPDTRLIVDAFVERHEVTAKEVRVREHPAPALVRVPDDRAGFAALVTFAHTYNGYNLHGGTEGLSKVVLPVHRHWERTGELPDDVDVLRACLFLQQRSHYRDGGSWDFETEPFVVALLARIRALSGGTVPLRSPMTAPQFRSACPARSWADAGQPTSGSASGTGSGPWPHSCRRSGSGCGSVRHVATTSTANFSGTAARRH